ncbi:MAG: sigma-70 family RNA polymerase sigma factor [Gemmatimonadaceae bacterium]|nr:sigma-70 family RNA polymerase sigma factor [Gemmatimonadaceae bacterium]
MVTMPANLRALLETPIGSMRLAWKMADWARLSPVLQAWAHLGIPSGIGLSGDEVDDVVAHVLMRAWLQDVVPDNPKTWACKVARNRALDHLKSKDHSPHRVDLEACEVADDGAEDVGGRLDAALRVTRLRNAMRRLPADQRRCVYLHYLKNRSHEDIAQILGITVGTCKMRTHRGVKFLRSLYDDEPMPRLTAKGLPMRARGRPRVRSWREHVHELRADRQSNAATIGEILRPVAAHVEVLP